MPTALITGASRGLGLGLTRECAARGWRVLATCRDPRSADALREQSRDRGHDIEVHPLDVGDDEQIEGLARHLADERIDFLVNNAAWGNGRRRLDEVDYPTWERSLRINSYAPLKMAQAFVEHVARSERRVMVTVSSEQGSIEAHDGGPGYVYRASKAAANMVVRALAADLSPRGVVVVSVHPGWVRTAMGGPGASLSVEESARAVVDVMAGLGIADSGAFLDHQRRRIPF